MPAQEKHGKVSEWAQRPQWVDWAVRPHFSQSNFQASNLEITKVASHVKMMENLPGVSDPIENF